MTEQGSGLRLTFAWSGDRYAQQIDYCHRGAAARLLTSREDDDRAVWPISPPLQQLTLEPRPRGPVALLVGMAGTSHWSVSIEADNDPAQMTFDVACRVGQQPTFLGSTYDCEQPLRAAGEGRVILVDGVVLEWLPVCAETATSAEPIQVAQHQIQIVAARHPATGTLRWKYRLALETPH